MCGRFYVDREMIQEMERLVENLDQMRMEPGDVCPSQSTAVLKGQRQHLAAEGMVWGFPRFDGRGLLINARAENALEKPSFKESVHKRRCVIPARGFYEWNRQKEKFMFEDMDYPVIYMAGCYNCFAGQNRFVILTTQANDSVSAVHERMPLILQKPELESWLTDDEASLKLLLKKPELLKVKTDYEQIKLPLF